MASIIRKPRSKYWFACFRDLHGRQHRKSTDEKTDRKKAFEVAKHYELVAQRKIRPQKVRETLSELYRQIYGATVPVATLRQYTEDWLRSKEPETAHATLAGYCKSTNKFLAYLGTDADREISEITRTYVADFDVPLSQKFRLQLLTSIEALRMLFRSAHRDGFILGNPAEFTKPVRRMQDQRRRPFTVPEIQAIRAWLIRSGRV